MKKLFCAFFFLFAITSFAKSVSLPEVDQVVPATDLDSDTIQELIKGNLPNLAVEFPEGQTIPLHFLSNIKVFSIFCDPNISVKAHSNCYFRFVGNKVYVSLNLTDWEKSKNFFKGAFNTSYKMKRDEKKVVIETNLVDFESTELPY